MVIYMNCEYVNKLIAMSCKLLAGHKKRDQPLTLIPNLHMNLPYCFIIRSVCFSFSLNNCKIYKPAGLLFTIILLKPLFPDPVAIILPFASDNLYW